LRTAQIKHEAAALLKRININKQTHLPDFDKEAHMNCPKCKTDLTTKMKRGIEVDHCDDCQGMWLDFAELDELEDVAYSKDDYKGSLLTSERNTQLLCPTCSGDLISFKYRFNDLVLEYCPAEHGFWLDAGEDDRVLELMSQREKDIKRSSNAESEFADFLQSLRKKSFISKIKKFFR
jgi:uncharacterized protein